MSISEDAPYQDMIDEEGRLIYEGHDVTKRESKQPKSLSQPFFTKSGKLTENGKFFKAAEDYRLKRREKPEPIQVYEKISSDVWVDKGKYALINARYIYDEVQNREVFRFVLSPLNNFQEKILDEEEYEDFEFSRRIPTNIKQLVWERDNGQCRICGTEKGLHFDHIIPFSKGGSSKDPKNIQLLCGRHNLQKSNKIM